jgi:glutaminyl-peptide cyclotransferase
LRSAAEKKIENRKSKIESPTREVQGFIPHPSSLIPFAAALLGLLAHSAWAFDQHRAFVLLEAQCAFGPRNPGSDGHQMCLDFLVRELKFWADTVWTQPFTYESDSTKETLSLTNIVGQFNPRQKDRVLLCAHWDSRPFADRDPNPANRNTPILGANDGASGVAVLLEIARQIHLQRVKIGVDIVLYDGEDYGQENVLDDYLIGSKYYAQHMNDPKPRFAVLLDMIGDRELHIPIESNSWRYSKPIVDKIIAAARRQNVARIENRPSAPVMDDHIPLLEAGIPAVDLIDMDYAYWHTLQDTPDNCSPYSLGDVGRTLLDMLRHEDAPK